MHRWLLSRVLVAGLVAAVAAAGNAGAEGTDEADLAAAEARLALVALTEQNAKLREDVEALRSQVKDLTVTLAQTVAELDVARAAAGKAGAPGNAPTAAVVPADGDGIAVVDVNGALGMVVLAAGESAGVKPGMRFAVMRDRRLVARVRASDVREAIAGAVVEELEKDDFPVKGDRAIVWRESGK